MRGLTICRRNRTFGSCLFFADVLPESYLSLNRQLTKLLNFKIPYLYSCAHNHLLHSRVVPRRGFDRKDMYSHLIILVTFFERSIHPVHAMHTLIELETVE